MRSLWRGVVVDSAAAARPSFFPVRAYLQVKAIADPRLDWSVRLFDSFKLDLNAAHALLGAGAKEARFVGVRVPTEFEHWVSPGACYNRVGYWEVPNARVLYRQKGLLRSFGIASMISWRGVWYVVHMGAVLRAANVGVVDSPSSGPGVSVNSGTC